MAKLTILGNDRPIIGVVETYTVINLLNSTIFDIKKSPAPLQYNWNLEILINGVWQKRPYPKTGSSISYRLDPVALTRKGVKLTVSKGNEYGELLLYPQPAVKPQIHKVELLDANYSPIPRGKRLTYGDVLNVKAQTSGMYAQKLTFNLWEDDAEGEGHNSNNTFIAKQTTTVNAKGVAEAKFRLMQAYIAKANAKLAPGDKSEGKTHEYYVVAFPEDLSANTKHSPNVNVNNPAPEVKVFDSNILLNSLNKIMTDALGKGVSLKEVYFTDSRDKKIGTANKPKYGDTLKLIVKGKNLHGVTAIVKLFEEDTVNNDLLYNKEHVLSSDNNFISIVFTQAMQEKGNSGEIEGWEQEIYAQVILKESKVEAKSSTINIDETSFTPTAKPENRTPAQAKSNPVEKTTSTSKCSRCEADITVAQLKQVYTSASDAHLKELAETLNKYKKVFKLDTCARKAHFFAQSREESGANLSGALHGESLDYAAEKLPIQFKKFRKRNVQGQAVDKNGNPTTDNNKTVPNDLAYKYGRTSEHAANQKKIAEIAYGDRGGNLTSEDAWNFRGRGLLQITFRGTYGEIQKRIDKLASDSGVKISDGQDRDYTPKEAAVTGMADWYKDDMFIQADKTGKLTDDKVVDLIVDIINKDTDSREKRKKHYKTTKVVFEVSQCPEIIVEKKIETSKKGYDIEKAVAHLNSNASAKSKGKCALYVRQAINAGGIYNLSGHAREYYDTDKLVKVGFKKLGTNIDSIQLKKGDIAAFSAVKGHSYGHIAMYNGTQWVSDFKQRSFWVATQYEIEKKYAIYRWE